MPFNIKIICFGTKRSSFQGEVDRYCKMLKPFGALKVEYLKPLSNIQGSVEEALKKEQKLIESKIKNGSYVVVLGEEGKVHSDSKKFASWLGSCRDSGKELVFILGSAHGVSVELKEKSAFLLSLSPLTMPYSLCLVVLVEQIYRAYTILSRHPYHK